MGSQDNIQPRTPDGQLCYPQCSDSIKPCPGMTFHSLPEAVKFYKDYAEACGFEAHMSTNRKSKDDTITRQYVVCNRERVWVKAKEPLIRSNDSKSKKRKTTSCKVDCKAKVIFKLAMGTCYKITEFVECHTHSMVPLPARDLMQSNRNLDEFKQRFILSGIKANIGPMRSFRMFREIMGSYEGIGCTGNDFKNFARDLKVHSKGSDAHMLLETFINKQELGNGFKFFNDVDEDNKLCRIIWVDETSVKNFSLFGEAVSFDATYNTIKTTYDSIVWTDCDDAYVFEDKWNNMIQEFDLSSNKWFTDMFVNKNKVHY